MLFHAFKVVYTVKELDSHAKHGQSFKKWFGSMTVFLWQKSYFHVRTSFWKIFSIEALHDVNEGGTPYMGISPGRPRPCTHRPERACAHQRASFSSTAQNSLWKNVSKEVCFWLWGKDKLVQPPEEPSVTWTVDALCFSGQQRSFSSVFVDERFINKAQFDAGFAHRLILKDGAVLAIKDPGHDSELQTVIETASNVFVFWAIEYMSVVLLYFGCYVMLCVKKK